MKKTLATLVTAAAVACGAASPAAAQEAPASPVPAVSQSGDMATGPDNGAAEPGAVDEDVPTTAWLTLLESSQQGNIGVIIGAVLGVVTVVLSLYGAFKDVLPNPAALVK